LQRNCLLEHVIEGKIDRMIEEIRRQRRRHMQLLGDLMEMRGEWKLKKEALITLCGEHPMEEAMDLSEDRL
jgi:hypothetical protein